MLVLEFLLALNSLFGGVAFLVKALGFEDDALQFLKNSEVLVGKVHLGVALFFRNQETDFFQALELALDISGVFFDKFGQSADVRLKVWILCVYDYDFPPDP